MERERDCVSNRKTLTHCATKLFFSLKLCKTHVERYLSKLSLIYTDAQIRIFHLR